MKAKSEGEVTQSCPTPSDPMDCSPPGSTVPGILQARTLEWGAIAFPYLIILVVFIISVFYINFAPPLICLDLIFALFLS